MTKSRTVRLGDVSRFIRGITFKPNDTVDPFSQDSVICMRTKNVQKDLDQKDLIAVPKSFVRRKEQFIGEGDILVSSANSWDLVGKCSWVPSLKYDATAGGFISVLRGDDNKINARYLYYWLNSPAIQHKMRHCGRQTTNISNLNFELALEQEIPLPSLAEQKRIAVILDKADAIRRKRQAAIKLADDFLRATFLDMFGDPVTNPKGWKIDSLGKHCDELRYGTSLKCSSQKSDNTMPVLRIPNVIGGEVNCDNLVYVAMPKKEKDKLKLIEGDLLFVRTNGNPNYIGRCAVYYGSTETLFASYLIRARLKRNGKLLPDFVQACIASETYRKFIVREAKTTAGNFNINIQGLKGLIIPMAPMSRQENYIDIKRCLQKLITRQGSSEKDLEFLLNSLAQRAFRGDL